MTLLFLLYYSGLPNDLGDYDETPDITAQHMKVCLCSHCFNSLNCTIFVCGGVLFSLYIELYNVATNMKQVFEHCLLFC